MEDLARVLDPAESAGRVDEVELFVGIWTDALVEVTHLIGAVGQHLVGEVGVPVEHVSVDGHAVDLDRRARERTDDQGQVAHRRSHQRLRPRVAVDTFVQHDPAPHMIASSAGAWTT